MSTKLYVGNLSPEATEHGLRAHFSTAGGVADVEILTERRSGRPKGLAWVTMTSPAFATAAVDRLDGATFDGRPLRVSNTPLRDANKAEASRVKITQQFRERGNMTYELDCAGAPLSVRVFPDEGERWRVEARTNEATGAAVIAATGTTRRAALDDVARSWAEQAASLCLPALDWGAIATALSTVRAV